MLQYIKQNSKKELVVVAPTGVAALNVGGQTIHSLFRLPPTFIELKSLRVDQQSAKILRNIEALVIDEVSMVRVDVMDAIDYLLRKARKDNSPFGGVQMVMFGDLYQLPPVVNDMELLSFFDINNGGFYFFNSLAWNQAELEIYELQQNFRQSDETFRRILNAIRIGEIDGEIINELNKRAGLPVPIEGILTLATTNSTVFGINYQKLEGIPDEACEYKATIEGKLEESAFPTEKILRLKRGAQIMMLKNDAKKRWVNGSLGQVVSATKTGISIGIDGTTYDVGMETWNKIKYYFDVEKGRIEEEVVSSFTQFPLRLAWAITVHKSQGQTYESVVIDMGHGAFAAGQTYVALSRCKSLENLYLKRPLTIRDVIVDPAVMEFMKKANINRL